MTDLIDTLRSGDYSCVVQSGGVTRTFTRRGVADVFLLLRDEPEFLRGAAIADKVVGKGGAALMALGGVARVWAEVVSTPALDLLRDAGIEVSFGVETPSIRNRADTDACPLEIVCGDETDPRTLYPKIERFVLNKLNINTL